MPIEKSPLQIFYDRLKHHDWCYDYSDDPGVFDRGNTVRCQLECEASQSEDKQALYNLWREYGRAANMAARKPPPYPLQFICDRKRHVICWPYSEENLHRMAASLGIKRAWFHKGKKMGSNYECIVQLAHYDMPKKRQNELLAIPEMRIVTSREIIQIIKEAARAEAIS